ncbi:MAG: hypothetical protein AAF944_28485 [Bacteroidota bacterium]
MNYGRVYEALRKVHSPEYAGRRFGEVIIQGFSELEVQNLDKLKDIFATKEDLFSVKEELSVAKEEIKEDVRKEISRIDSKIDKIYWFILGQTTDLVLLFMAILRLTDVI